MRRTTKMIPGGRVRKRRGLSLAGCGTVDQAVCDDVGVLEQQLAGVEGELQPEVAQEARDDYAEIATDANCPGYDEDD